MRKAQSAILEAVRATAKRLHTAGVMNQLTRASSTACVCRPSKPWSPKKSRRFGKRLEV